MTLTAHCDPFQGPGPDRFPKGLDLGAKSGGGALVATAPSLQGGAELALARGNGGVLPSQITVVHNSTAAMM
jgi:hypothetical protein